MLFVPPGSPQQSFPKYRCSHFAQPSPGSPPSQRWAGPGPPFTECWPFGLPTSPKFSPGQGKETDANTHLVSKEDTVQLSPRWVLWSPRGVGTIVPRHSPFPGPLCMDTLHVSSCLNLQPPFQVLTHWTEEETETQSVLAITQSRVFLAWPHFPSVT